MNPIRISLALAVLAAFTLLSAHGALAQSDEDFIKYRQKVMGSLGANMGGIGDILKQGLPVKGNIANHAAAINATAKNIAAAFEKQVTSGATDAKPNIWADWSDFRTKIKALEDESAKLMQVAGSAGMNGLGDQVKALGQSCGGCHKEFRKPKEESYKRK